MLHPTSTKQRRVSVVQRKECKSSHCIESELWPLRGWIMAASHSLLLAFFLLCGQPLLSCAYSCGITEISASSSSSSGTISSPNYPSNYGALNKCVWRITAPNYYSIWLEIPEFLAEAKGCPDVLEVRNGTRVGDVLLKLCTTNLTRSVVLSPARYLWIQFSR